MKPSIGAIASCSLLIACAGADPTGTMKASARSGTTMARSSWERSNDEPLPIPGVLDPSLPFFHAFAPGPTPTYQGFDVEPSTITNFKGVSMISEDYTLTQTATGSDGTHFLVGTDMRVMKGTYRTLTGEHHATFVFI